MIPNLGVLTSEYDPNRTVIEITEPFNLFEIIVLLLLLILLVYLVKKILDEYVGY